MSADHYQGPPTIVEVGQASDDAISVAREEVRRGRIVLVRQISLGPTDLLAIAEQLGPVFSPVALPPARSLQATTDLRASGEVTYATNWHHDQSFVDRPPDWSLLYCVAPGVSPVPTVFADGAGLLEFVTPGLLEMLRTLSAEHIAHYPTNDNAVGEIMARATHPVVLEVEPCVPAVFVAPATVRSFVGWTRRESATVLDYLFAMFNWPELCVSHVWRRADLLIWPNRRFPHRALPLDAGSLRQLTRVVGHWGSQLGGAAL